MACRNRELETMSVRKQIRVMGAEKADDLISTMILDHEQADRSDPRTATPTRPPTTSTTTSTSTVADSDNPLTSLVSRLWRSKTVTEDLVPQPLYLAVKQTHWKPKEKALKCSNPNCRVLFPPALNKRRNCAMCGEVFCRNCTNYSRRLAINAQPDPLGRFYSVCQACFNYHKEFGGMRDHMGEFHTLRQRRLELISNSEHAQESFSLCSRRSTECKKVAMREEVGRLVKGFQTNHGKYKDILEVKVPEWQKSSNWVPSRNALACLNCGSTFGMIKCKLHCRIGGQVFCSNCAGEDLILYLDEDEEVRWALNGKEGGPTDKPDRFRLLVVCQSCSLELQDILVEKICRPRPSVFLDSLTNLHAKLSKELALIETNMPGYKQLVESMEASDCSPRHIEDRHPMRRLIKAQLDLSDAFSSLAVDSQVLKTLRPKSHLQEKLLRNVMMGTYRSYSDNMFSFRNLKNHLTELVPIETMGVIQESLSQQSMERVHVIVQQLIYEALNLEHKYRFDNGFFTPIITISNHIDSEFKEFTERRGESWGDHGKVIMRFIEEQMKNGHNMIKIDEALRQTKTVHYLVVSQCASLIHECYRELQAKTIDREFKMVKESLREGCEKLDSTLLTLNS